MGKEVGEVYVCHVMLHSFVENFHYAVNKVRYIT